MRSPHNVSTLTNWYLALHVKEPIDGLFGCNLYIDHMEGVDSGDRINFTIGSQSCDCDMKFVHEKRYDVLTRCLMVVFDMLERERKQYPKKIRQICPDMPDTKESLGRKTS